MTTSRNLSGLLLLGAFALGGSLASLAADDAAKPAPAAAAATPAKLFDSPDAAAKAVIEALKANDDEALKVIVGSGNEDIVQSGKDGAVARERKRVARLAEEKLVWEDLDDGTKVAVLGPKSWPMAIPLAPKDGKWFWDAAQGRDELLARRIGENELTVMDVLRATVAAQAVYQAQDRDGDGMLEYARRYFSTEGQKDGLYWPDEEGASEADRSPLGARIEASGTDPATVNAGAPFSGYRFKLLTAQGPCAPGGVLSFEQGGNLTLGFGVLAYPAEYKLTGVKSFIISHRGRLFERDLGAQTVEIASGITSFNPDSTWLRVGNP